MSDDERCGTCGWRAEDGAKMACWWDTDSGVDFPLWVFRASRIVEDDDGKDCPCWKPREESPE